MKNMRVYYINLIAFILIVVSFYIFQLEVAIGITLAIVSIVLGIIYYIEGKKTTSDIQIMKENLNSNKKRFLWEDVYSRLQFADSTRVSLVDILNKIKFDYVISTPGGPSIISNLAIQMTFRQLCSICVPVLSDLDDCISKCENNVFYRKEKIDWKYYYMPCLDTDSEIKDAKFLIIDDVTHTLVSLIQMREYLINNFEVQPDNIFCYCFVVSPTALSKAKKLGINISYAYLNEGKVELPWEDYDPFEKEV